MPYFDKYTPKSGNPRGKQERGEGRRENARARDEQRSREQDEHYRDRMKKKPANQEGAAPYHKPEGATRYGKPANRDGAAPYRKNDGAPRYGKPANRDGAASAYRDVGAEKPRYGKPAYTKNPTKPYGGTRPAFTPAPQQTIVPVSRPAFAPEEALPRENLLVGRNPIREAVKSGHDIEKLLVARGELSGSAREIVMKARERHIVVQEVDRTRLDAIAPNHQGMIAFVSAFQYSTVQKMLDLAAGRGEEPFLVLLDSVTDPHNLGAVIRTAECAGAHGVIIPERRAVGLTPAAVKASAGAVEYLPVARVTNLVRQIDELKKLGIWVYGAAMDGKRFDKVDLSGPAALVVGSEGEGVSRLALSHCDEIVALPMLGKIDSLNASVAAGVLMYEVVRRRLK